jgi:hypothetical protein
VGKGIGRRLVMCPPVCSLQPLRCPAMQWGGARGMRPDPNSNPNANPHLAGEAAECRHPTQAVRRWARPPCRHIKIQYCCFLGSGSRLQSQGSMFQEAMEVQMPLHNAAADGDVVNIRRLVAEGADVNLPCDGEARPLHAAAQEGQVDAVRVLVDAEVDASADNGGPPLHIAAARGHAAVVTALAELGADIGAVMDGGETPLQLSIRFGHHHVERMLRGAMARTLRPHHKGRRLLPRSPCRRPQTRRNAMRRS